MIRFAFEVTEERAVVDAKFVDHLRNADDVVIRGANEAYERFPGVLAQDTDAGEFGGFFGEVCV